MEEEKGVWSIKGLDWSLREGKKGGKAAALGYLEEGFVIRRLLESRYAGPAFPLLEAALIGSK